jgi:dephospho-CoA kinase
MPLRKIRSRPGRKAINNGSVAIASLENLAKQAEKYRQPLDNFLRPLLEDEPEAIVGERIRWAFSRLQSQ